MEFEAASQLEERARALHALGDYRGSLQAYEEAFAAYRDGGDLLAAARAARTVGWFRGWVFGEWAVYQGWAGQASRLLEQAGDPRAQGWIRYEQARKGFDLDTQRRRKWGMRWLEVAPEHLDPGMVLWALSKHAIPDRLPDRRLVIQFTFTGRPRLTLWALIDNGEFEACVNHRGGDEDLVITADPEWFVRWHFRRSTWAEATREGHIVVDGVRSLARGFPTWFAPNGFSEIKSAS